MCIYLNKLCNLAHRNAAEYHYASGNPVHPHFLVQCAEGYTFHETYSVPSKLLWV